MLRRGELRNLARRRTLAPRRGHVSCLVRLVVDVPDEDEHRAWMKEFKNRWKERLEQIDLWMVSYAIDIE